MFDVLAKARNSPLLAQQLDWPKRLSMALDAAKVQILIRGACVMLQPRTCCTQETSLLVSKKAWTWELS